MSFAPMEFELLSAEVRRFLLTNIPSVPFLEALLLFHGEPHISWSASSLAKRLYISEKKAEDLLSNLKEIAIVKNSDNLTDFIYTPASDELHSLIDELAIFYSKNLLEITHLIHSKTDRKAQQFADAFKLRKDS